MTSAGTEWTVLHFFAGDWVRFGFLFFFEVLEPLFDVRPATFGFAVSCPHTDGPAQSIKRQRTFAHGLEDRACGNAPANTDFLEAIYQVFLCIQKKMNALKGSLMIQYFPARQCPYFLRAAHGQDQKIRDIHDLSIKKLLSS
jgi:hypothetical protein